MGIYGNIIEQKRARLQDVIPLDTPFVVSLDPSNMCNFTCKFCGIQTMKNENLGGYSFSLDLLIKNCIRRLLTT